MTIDEKSQRNGQKKVMATKVVPSSI